jgi:hypothetical protein
VGLNEGRHLIGGRPNAANNTTNNTEGVVSRLDRVIQ